LNPYLKKVEIGVAGIRVIAGKAKGRRLKMVPGNQTRPVADRVKESVFNILASDVKGAAFWDVFAGTGSVGIEALSRGADYVLFTDNDRRAIETIHENLEITGFRDSADVERFNVFSLIEKPAFRQFDFAYIAPPQYKGLWSKALKTLDQNTVWLNPDAWVIVQIDPVEFEPQDLSHLEKFDSRTYGSTMVLFFEWTSEEGV
jgi:16S rRNA (guanine966-N2)-methyltransferase